MWRLWFAFQIAENSHTRVRWQKRTRDPNLNKSADYWYESRMRKPAVAIWIIGEAQIPSCWVERETPESRWTLHLPKRKYYNEIDMVEISEHVLIVFFFSYKTFWICTLWELCSVFSGEPRTERAEIISILSTAIPVISICFPLF